MNYIDHHAHMVSRTTDDYEKMALSGCVAITEPAFWAGWDRSSADGFEDYFRQLTVTEPQRAAAYHVKHYSWLAMNPKEADDRELSKEVLKRIPKFIGCANVLGIGEIGLNRITRNEVDTFREHVELAIAHKQLILIHTPHLEDKKKGTRICVEVLREYPELNPEHVLIDHAEEHTLEMILEHGYWAGLTLYPLTKLSAVRAVDIVETFGPAQNLRGRRVRLGPERSNGRAAIHAGNETPRDISKSRFSAWCSIILCSSWDNRRTSRSPRARAKWRRFLRSCGPIKIGYWSRVGRQMILMRKHTVGYSSRETSPVEENP